MSSMSISLPEQRQMCEAVIQPETVSSELLTVLYITHHRHVLQTCKKFFRQLEDAEDAAAEVFLKLYRVLHQKDELVPFRPWISQIAAHHCIDKLRRRKHEKSSSLEEVDVEGLVDNSSPSALSEVIRNETEGQIRQALTSLPEKHRVVLVLHYYNRMRYSQIANALNMSLSAVRVRIFRAKRFLRHKLGRAHRTDTFTKTCSEQRTVRRPGHKHDTAAINRPRRFKVPASAGIETLHPVPTLSKFYVGAPSAGADQRPC